MPNSRTYPKVHRNLPQALGESDVFLQFQEQVSKVAKVDRPVLILGERGTGKELAAARLHFLSHRWERPFVTLNCAALTSGLIGSELFGYEKGAFTGADQRRKGRFEQADGGTLFLDEIGAIPMDVQEKILRIVEYGGFERVGSSVSVQVDVRIVAATNADLVEMSSNGKFKQDLLDRLAFEVIHAPPLRFRAEDILLLSMHFAARMALELGWNHIPVFHPESENLLTSHDWPGNIRELKNVIERSVYKSDGKKNIQISPEDFNPFKSPYQEQDPVLEKVQRSCLVEAGEPCHEELLHKLFACPLKEAVRYLETYRVSQGLEQSNWNQKKAASLLGISYDQFRGIKKRLDI